MPSAPAAGLRDITSADVDELVDATSEDVLAEINARAGRRVSTRATILWTLGIAFVAMAISSGLATFVLVVGFGWLALDAIWRETHRAVLTYELDDEANRRFSRMKEAVAVLGGSARLWRIEAQQLNADWKRGAGATMSVRRTLAAVWHLRPPGIATNVDVWSIRAGGTHLYWFPDRLLVYQNGRYGAAAYDALRVTCTPTRFVEHEGMPHDAQVVGTTWQFVNKDGQPDRRFNNNRQLPIVMYGEIQITSSQGLNIILQASNLSLAQTFADLLASRRRASQDGPASTGATRHRPPAAPPPAPPTARTPWQVLGVPEGSSRDEITAAYHRMAQMNHPDKVAGMAPEFRQLAERRMREINAAYAMLIRNAS